MATPHKVQCDYKQIDWFQTLDGTEVIVTLLANKHSIKRYCEDVELPFGEGLKRLYQNDYIPRRDLLDDSYIRHSLNKGTGNKISNRNPCKAKVTNEQESSRIL